MVDDENQSVVGERHFPTNPIVSPFDEAAVRLPGLD